MKINIENKTNLRELKLKKDIELELPENSKVKDLISELGLERLVENDGSISSLVIMQKNKKTVQSVKEDLEDKDTIKIMPTAAGG